MKGRHGLVSSLQGGKSVLGTWSWKVLRATITVHAISQAVQFPVRPRARHGHGSPGDHNLICTPVTCRGKSAI